MRRTLFAGLVVAAALAACERGTDASLAELTVELTDAPNPMVERATAYISGIYLVGGGDHEDSTGPHTTISTESQSFDLLTLTNGITATMAEASIPVGAYAQLRVVVDSATITLRAPFQFSDGSTTRTLQTPSGQQSGIKVTYDDGRLLIIPSGETTVVVDFDVARNFLFTGPDGAPTGVQFRPVLHAVKKHLAGSVSGTVTPASAHAMLYAIVDDDTVRSAFADTVTGAYTLRFLTHGQYKVSVLGTGIADSLDVLLGIAENATGVDFPPDTTGAGAGMRVRR